MATCTRARLRHIPVAACLCLAAWSCVAPAQRQAAPTATRQIAEDQRAYRAARNTADAGGRVDALLAFVKKYPSSVYTAHARQLALDTLLAEFPSRLSDIDATARAIVEAEHKGYDRWDQQMHTADELAGAGPNGADLTLATAWIAEADRQMTEEHFLAAQKEQYRSFGVPLPKADALHRTYRHKRAEVLLVLAHVAIKQGKLPEATAWLDQSAALEPLTGELNYLRGEVALLQHRNAEALELFERATLLGELPAAQRKDMLLLYRDAHGGSGATLEADLDRQYATLYPAAFQPPARRPADAPHTVLLELYTGAACAPCVGGDLALDALLGAYSRHELVALALDEHVPLPDPLTNPSTAARAEVYGVRSTPGYVLDGRVLHLYGTDRDGSAELYQQLSEAVDARTDLKGAVRIRLARTGIEGETVSAQAEIAVQPEAALRARTAQQTAEEEDEPENEAGGEQAKPGRGGTTASEKTAPLPKLSLVFALVEDHVRYSGQNGVRFHRMVVRAIDRQVALGLSPGATTQATAHFNLDEVARTNANYLEEYEKRNDRFGPVKFLSRQTAMQPGQLSIAAWVEDVTTHRVLEAAFLPVTTQVPTGSEADATEGRTP